MGRILRCRGDSGGTLVEYTVLVALIAGVVLVAAQALGTTGEGSFETASGGLAGAPSDPGEPPPAGGTGSGGSGDSGGAGTSPPASAPAPTTTVAPTPDPVPTTTLPLSPPAPAPTSTGVTWSGARTSGNNGKWTATAGIEVLDDTGRAVPGAVVTVAVRARTWMTFFWYWSEYTVEVSTGSDGSATVAQTFKGSEGHGHVGEVEYRVRGVDAADGVAWDAEQAAVTFDRP